MLNRRKILSGLSAGAAIAMTGCGPKETSAAKSNGAEQLDRISKIGLQTYTLREVFKTDPLGMFQMIKQAGYDYVELNSGNFTQVKPEALKGMLDETGLTSPVSHISLDLIKGSLDPLMQTAKTLNMEYLVVPYIADNLRSYEDWKAHAKLMARAGKILNDNGLKLAYHNHQFEFTDLGGGTNAMDILLNDVPEEVMDFEIDIFWAALADVDIPSFLKANPGRFKLCHVKDMGPNKADFADASYDDINTNLMKNVGEGIIDFESIFAVNDISGMEYFIAEHDNPPKPYENALATSHAAIKAMRF